MKGLKGQDLRRTGNNSWFYKWEVGEKENNMNTTNKTSLAFQKLFATGGVKKKSSKTSDPLMKMLLED